jgi:ABC-2 type transport system permease protein
MSTTIECQSLPYTPPPRRAIRKYAAVAGTAFRQGLRERGALVARVGFYMVILLIFSRLWDLVAAHGAVGASKRELVWYLAITEWVVLSLPLIHLQIEADVRTGDIAYRLPRPISYLGFRLSESLGDLALRLGVLAIAGVGLAWTMAGGPPEDPRGLWLALPLGLLASFVGLCFHAAIGLCAIWLQDSTPVYWVWQKLAFVLGGLFVPLEVYPDWLRDLAFWTPFSAMMHGPGRMAFGWQPELAGLMAAKLLGWGALAVLLLAFVYRRSLRALDVNGG